jgi:TPR repeat protein
MDTIPNAESRARANRFIAQFEGYKADFPSLMKPPSAAYRSAIRLALVLAMGSCLSFFGPMTTAYSQSAGNGNASAPTSGQPTMGNQAFAIDEAEIPRVRAEALGGSGDAAIRLANNYGDTPEGSYWTTIAAENGSVVGMYNLAQFLRNKYETESLIRARYWYERVVKSGEQPLADDAKRKLQDLGG